jgi:hypothetical protein
MENQNSIDPSEVQLNPKPEVPHSHKVLIYVFVGFFALAVIAGIYYWQTTSNLPSTFDLPKHKVQDSTATWKTYSNSQYGFSFKYPNNWSLGGEPVSYGNNTGINTEISSSPGHPEFDIEIFNIKSNETVSDALQRITAINLSGLDKSTKLIDNLSAVYYRNIPGNVIYDEVVLIKNNKLYGLVQYTDNKTFDQILSTFKFTK